MTHTPATDRVIKCLTLIAEADFHAQHNIIDTSDYFEHQAFALWITLTEDEKQKVEECEAARKAHREGWVA